MKAGCLQSHQTVNRVTRCSDTMAMEASKPKPTPRTAWACRTPPTSTGPRVSHHLTTIWNWNVCSMTVSKDIKLKKPDDCKQCCQPEYVFYDCFQRHQAEKNSCVNWSMRSVTVSKVNKLKKSDDCKEC